MAQQVPVDSSLLSEKLYSEQVPLVPLVNPVDPSTSRIHPTFIPNFPSSVALDSQMPLSPVAVLTSPIDQNHPIAISADASSYGRSSQSLSPPQHFSPPTLDFSPTTSLDSPGSAHEPVPLVISEQLTNIASEVQNASSIQKVGPSVEAVKALRASLDEVINHLQQIQLDAETQSTDYMKRLASKRPPSLMESPRDMKQLKRETIEPDLPLMIAEATEQYITSTLPSIPSSESLGTLASTHGFFSPQAPHPGDFIPQYAAGSYANATSVPVYPANIGWPEMTQTTGTYAHVFPSSSSSSYSTLPAFNSPIQPPIGRMSSTGSMSGIYNNYSYQNGWSNPATDESAMQPPQFNTNSIQLPLTSTKQRSFYLADTPDEPTSPTSPGSDDEGYAEDSDQEEDDEEDEPHSASTGGTHGASSDVQPEYREQINRIFFEFLDGLCSNLAATDSKGVVIHQPLMPKKMQRLEESNDWRPFKFRIAAFTSAFLAEVSRQGYPEDMIPTKRLRQYLWRNKYLLRFNEEGKKAKSKGNHVWQVDSRRTRDGTNHWEYRPFLRKIAGTVPAAAYPGHKWSFTPKLHDAQCPWKGKPVQFQTTELPHWLSWHGSTIKGTVPADATDCTFKVTTKFVVGGHEDELSKEIDIIVTPTSSGAVKLASAQQPKQQRSVSESVVPRLSQSRPAPSTPASAENQVAQVLRGAAQIVKHERQSLVVSAPDALAINGLCRQENVLSRTLTAYSTRGPLPDQSQNLARAGERLVLQAAQTVRTVREAQVAGIPISPSASQSLQNVTIKDVTVAAQESVAQAIKMQPAVTPEQVVLNATAILRQEAISANNGL